jgi:hypothetical protein
MFNIFHSPLEGSWRQAAIAPPFRSSAASDDETGRRGDLFPNYEIFFDGRERKFSGRRCRAKSSAAAMAAR